MAELRNTIVNGTLEVTDIIHAKSDLNIEENLNTAGSATIHGLLTAENGAKITGALLINGDTTTRKIEIYDDENNNKIIIIPNKILFNIDTEENSKISFLKDNLYIISKNFELRAEGANMPNGEYMTFLKSGIYYDSNQKPIGCTITTDDYTNVLIKSDLVVKGESTIGCVKIFDYQENYPCLKISRKVNTNNEFNIETDTDNGQINIKDKVIAEKDLVINENLNVVNKIECNNLEVLKTIKGEDLEITNNSKLGNIEISENNINVFNKNDTTFSTLNINENLNIGSSDNKKNLTVSGLTALNNGLKTNGNVTISLDSKNTIKDNILIQNTTDSKPLLKINGQNNILNIDGTDTTIINNSNIILNTGRDISSLTCFGIYNNEISIKDAIIEPKANVIINGKKYIVNACDTDNSHVMEDVLLDLKADFSIRDIYGYIDGTSTVSVEYISTGYIKTDLARRYYTAIIVLFQ